MTYEEIAAIVKEMATALKCKAAYHHFNKAQQAPFLVYFYPENDDFKADGKNYVKITSLRFEFYTNKKSLSAEKIIESILQNHSLTYSKLETWISSENLFQISYQAEVIINA